MEHRIGMDFRIRTAAFEKMERLCRFGDTLEWSTIKQGFEFEGRRIHFASKAIGIFRPKDLPFVLSIKTVVPKAGRKFWYDDQQEAHKQVFEESTGVDYAFMKGGQHKVQNIWLRDAMQFGIPLIYFLGVCPGLYQVIYPVFVDEWHPGGHKARIVFSRPDKEYDNGVPSQEERKYALSRVKRRLHQNKFRLAVLDAYDRQCALSGLRIPNLIDAAHIIPDASGELGQPIVQNGLPLSKIHHAAFDRNFIGIDPDYRIHVSKFLLQQHDGPVLEALKGLHGEKLRFPLRLEDRPDPARLEKRFEIFSGLS